MNSILDSLSRELEAEWHEEQLRSGNLGRKRENPYALETHWTSNGYVARVLRSTCQSCGTQTDTLQGIFHRETNPLGNRRLVSLDLRHLCLPTSPERETEIESVQTPVCPDCLSAHGFSSPSQTL